MGLRTYRKKRDFAKTAEPRGTQRATTHRGGDGYLIQKHAASHLHFDFRLELDGVLLSWAVPKGPPAKVGARALAMHVEDHPLEYGSFEGVIPKGQYGGGTVMLWDRGSWQADGDARRGLRDGKLSFTIDGERLRGRWSLVRMAKKPGEKGEAWLLVKRSDARGEDVRTAVPGPDDTSIVSGRTMAEIAAAADRSWSSDGAAKQAARAKPTTKRVTKATKATKTTKARAPAAAVARHAAQLPGARAARQPRAFAPQLASLVAVVPDGDDWLHEMKFDGYRLLAFVDGEAVRLLTRSGQDWTARFPSVRDAVATLGLGRAVLDGEVVVLRPDGVSDFQLLQNLVDRGDGRGVVYFVFDLPHCAGFDLTRAPLLARKQLLARVLGAPRGGVVRVSEHVTGHGAAFFRQACALGLEGVVSKLGDSHYQTKRSRSWVKVKCLQRQELVVGGFTRPEGSRTHFGALLVGVYDDAGALRFAGKVGTGFTAASLAELARRLRPRIVEAPPFVDPPRGAEAKRATWVRPGLVVEVAFTEWTGDGKLRHPSFQGVREDKDARSIRREVAATAAPAATAATAAASAKPPRPKASAGRAGSRTDEPDVVAGVRISNPQRVLFPAVGVRKLDVARYYEAVAEHVLPHVAGRPLAIVRCPQGLQAACFFQKHLAKTLPPPVTSYRVEEKNGSDDYLGIEDVRGLVTLVQFGALELHPWGSRATSLEKPDRIVVDLDPGPGVKWADVVAAMHELRGLFDALGLASFPRTSGGKGLHVVVPIVPGPGWDEVKAFAHDVVAALARHAPAKYVTTATKAQRRGRIFLDWLRNGRGATAVASYSTRAREHGTVAMPLAWDEVTTKLDPLAFTTRSVPSLLASRGDAWPSFFQTKQHLTAAQRAAVQQA
jgi:bifunctional non-homologous end joining protein LigD